MKTEYKTLRPITYAASVATAVSLLICLAVPKNFKPWFAVIAFSSLASAASLTLSEGHFKTQLNNVGEEIDNSKEKIKREVKKEMTEKQSEIDEWSRLFASQKIELGRIHDELKVSQESNYKLIKQIEALNLNIEKSKKNLEKHLKTKDLRVEDFVRNFRESLLEIASNKIFGKYETLKFSVQREINKENDLQTRFERFLERVTVSQYEIAEKIDNFAQDLSDDHIQIIVDAIDLHSQLWENFSNYHAGFRALLNAKERAQLDETLGYVETLDDTHLLKSKALEHVREYRNYQAERLDAIYNRIDNSDLELKGFQAEIDDLVNQLEAKNLLIAKLNEPIRWSIATRDDLRIGNGIIAYFQPLVFDRAYSDYRKHEATLYFHIDRNSRIILPSELNEHSEKLQQLLHTLAPVKFEWDAEQGLMKANVLIARKVKVESTEESKIPTCESIVKNSSRGFLILGHPGAGKTSTIKAISQWIADDKAMRLALNPHADEMSSFISEGFIEINNLEDIYQAIKELNIELKLRGTDKNRRHPLIIACDELGRILKDAPKDLDVMEELRQAAVEGRKFNITILIGNHSGTVEAIDMDGQFRESFYQLFLVGSAVYKVNSPKPPVLKNHEINWILDAPYPTLTSVNGKFRACQHATHSVYKEYQDSGLPPIGLVKLPQNIVTLGNQIYGLDPKQCTNCGSLNTVSNKGRGRKKTCKDCGENF